MGAVLLRTNNRILIFDSSANVREIEREREGGERKKGERVRGRGENGRRKGGRELEGGRNE